LGLNLGELFYDASLPGYPAMPLTAEMLKQVQSNAGVVSVEANLDEYPADYPDSYLSIFPFVEDYHWTRDYFGPLWIPSKGSTVEINEHTLPLYTRIIRDYEQGDLQKAIEDGTYTFKQDYYWMMGDNRHNSLDSRYWGFVPEDHIVGTPTVIWLSTIPGKKFPNNIRWNRFLKFV